MERTCRTRSQRETLTLDDVPDAFTLETVTRIVPQKNTKLEGLYATQSGFVTQCEAQGFRRITWFVDRPDNLARLHGHRARRHGEVPGAAFERQSRRRRRRDRRRHWAKFEDPFPKPCYLFALVAADLEFIRRL